MNNIFKEIKYEDMTWLEAPPAKTTLQELEASYERLYNKHIKLRNKIKELKKGTELDSVFINTLVRNIEAVSDENKQLKEQVQNLQEENSQQAALLEQELGRV